MLRARYAGFVAAALALALAACGTAASSPQPTTPAVDRSTITVSGTSETRPISPGTRPSKIVGGTVSATISGKSNSAVVTITFTKAVSARGNDEPEARDVTRVLLGVPGVINRGNQEAKVAPKKNGGTGTAVYRLPVASDPTKATVINVVLITDSDGLGDAYRGEAALPIKVTATPDTSNT